MTGAHKVKKVIPWPRDFCSITSSKQPMYDDLSALYWAQGMICCALDKHYSKLRTNMLKHFVSMLQHTVELSYSIARWVHSIIFQEIEKGVLGWDRPKKIEKLMARNTQRAVASANKSKVIENSDKTYF